MLFDGTGSFGLGLGGFDVSDFLGLTGSGGIGTITYDISQTIPQGQSIYNPTEQNILSGQQDVANYQFPGETLQNNTGLYGKSSSILGAQGYGQNAAGTDWMDNILKGATLGLSAYNDYQNRKTQRHALNEDIRLRQNGRERSKSIQRQLTGDPDSELSGSDYKFI